MGGTKTGSLSGGISARSEKLVPGETAAESDIMGSDIIGSTATRGACCSDSCSTTAADKTGPRPAWDSGALTAKSLMRRAPDFESELESDFEPKLESDSIAKLALDTRAALPAVTAPAAAAAALVPTAGGAVCARTHASPPEEAGETNLGETGCAVPEAAATTSLAPPPPAPQFTPTLTPR